MKKITILGLITLMLCLCGCSAEQGDLYSFSTITKMYDVENEIDEEGLKKECENGYIELYKNKTFLAKIREISVIYNGMKDGEIEIINSKGEEITIEPNGMYRDVLDNGEINGKWNREKGNKNIIILKCSNGMQYILETDEDKLMLQIEDYNITYKKED